MSAGKYMPIFRRIAVLTSSGSRSPNCLECRRYGHYDPSKRLQLFTKWHGV